MSPDTCSDPAGQTCYFRLKRGLQTRICPRLTVWCPECQQHVRVQRVLKTIKLDNGAREVRGQTECGHTLRENIITRVWGMTEATHTLVKAANRLRRERVRQ